MHTKYKQHNTIKGLIGHKLFENKTDKATINITGEKALEATNCAKAKQEKTKLHQIFSHPEGQL